ncbi:MAG TPA: DUF3800 domain-containing protein [Candidatus Cloacimonas sp.]|nr:DUF3800 domain-containing protein [Candidatus Cloacimonas sp.]
MIKCDTSHIAFFDESNWNKGRFRSISMISLEYLDYLELRPLLYKITTRMHHEMKWTNIDVETGLQVIKFVFDNLHKLRIDVLTWDMEDSKHKGVAGRDDEQDLQRLYFRLMKTVMRDRWPNEATWTLCPDEHDCISWQTIKGYLNDHSWDVQTIPFDTNPFQFSFISRYTSKRIEPLQSHHEPFIQLADFFAGMAAYSFNCFDKVMLWKEAKSNQTTIFDSIGEETKPVDLTKRDLLRIPLIWEIKIRANHRKMRISLKSASGLVTRNPFVCLNFWLYQPQHENDKAPTRPKT